MSASTSGGQAFTGRFDAATKAILPSDAVTHLHLLRHGDVARMHQRIVRGQLDEPVSPRGVEEHRSLARFVAEREPRLDVLYTSDLSRCRVLAEELGARIGLAPIVDARLREQSMGAWEGSSWADVSAREPAAVTAYWNDYAHARPTGGESMADVARRTGEWWNEAHARHRGARVAAVTHVGAIRTLLCRFLDHPLDSALRFAPATASQTTVAIADAGAVVSCVGERPWAFDPIASVATTNEVDVPRYALSGSAGTGKTTLGRALAARLGVPFLEEGMRRRIEAGFVPHGFTVHDWRALSIEMWEEHRAAEAAATSGFVSDRSSLDFAAFWLHYGMHEVDGPTDAVLQSLFEHAKSYDRVFLFPWGALPLVNDGVRSTNRWIQFRFQTVLEGLVERFAPANVVRVPATTSFDARLAFASAVAGV